MFSVLNIGTGWNCNIIMKHLERSYQKLERCGGGGPEIESKTLVLGHKNYFV